MGLEAVQPAAVKLGGPSHPAGPPPLLSVRNLEVVYHDVVLVLRGVSLAVAPGSVVALLGANGAGKTTLLRAVSGLLDVHRGRVTKGSAELAGRQLVGLDAARIVRSGLAQAMEGRRIFAALTVEENLRAGAASRSGREELKVSYDRVYDLFPLLAERRRSTAGYLSGGEQQMLAIGRALMAAPKLLLLDEPSLGLAPSMVSRVAEAIAAVRESGISMLLVEQNADMALDAADYGYVLEHGRIVKDGPSAELRADRDIQEFYLGIGEAGRRSFRDVKSYRRRKRWSA